MKIGGAQQRPPWPTTPVTVLAGVVVACLLLMAACNRTTSQTTAITQAPIVMTPSVIEEQLSPALSLASAAAQLADALGVSSEAVRVRIRPRGCITCSAEENQEATSLVGLAVAEASAHLQPDDDLWLFVQQLTCMYHFNGSTLIPQGCRLAPV